MLNQSKLDAPGFSPSSISHAPKDAFPTTREGIDNLRNNALTFGGMGLGASLGASSGEFLPALGGAAAGGLAGRYLFPEFLSKSL